MLGWFLPNRSTHLLGFVLYYFNKLSAGRLSDSWDSLQNHVVHNIASYKIKRKGNIVHDTSYRYIKYYLWPYTRLWLGSISNVIVHQEQWLAFFAENHAELATKLMTKFIYFIHYSYRTYSSPTGFCEFHEKV